MMNRRINVTMLKMLMTDGHDLRVHCPLARLFFRLTSLILSPLYVKCFTSRGPYSFHFNGNRKDLSRPHAAFVLRYAKPHIAGFWRYIADCSNKRSRSRCDFFGLATMLKRTAESISLF